MRPLVLVLVLAALLAPARLASIQQPEPEEDLELEDDDIEEAPVRAPVIDDTDTVKDLDNHLRMVPIPVKVIEDVQPQKDVEDTVKRVEIDLKHPGEPQRQEHETQNPEHYADEQGAVAAVKQMIKDTQSVFNKGFADVSERLVEWVSDNKPEVTIVESIQQLRNSFTENIDKINSTIQSYWSQADDTEKKVDIQKVQSGLKVLEEKFATGVETLNTGVRNLAVLKETRDDASTTTAKPVQGIQFPGFVTNFWTTVTQGIGNVTNQFQSIVGQGGNVTAPGVQSDETSASTSKPSVWQGIQNQIQGIFQGRPQGAQSDEQPSGPFAQVIQNVPLLQNFVNFIQPKPQSDTPSKPAQSTSSNGSNAVPDPAKPDQQQKKPDELVAPAAQPAPAAQGPIQQIIQKNPIVQGITGAVQKIQHSITNPERPREESIGDKAGWYGGYGHRPVNGDNNNVSGNGVKSAPIEAERPSDEATASQEAKPASPEVPASPEAVKQD